MRKIIVLQIIIIMMLFCLEIAYIKFNSMNYILLGYFLLAVGLSLSFIFLIAAVIGFINEKFFKSFIIKVSFSLINFIFYYLYFSTTLELILKNISLD